MVDLWRKGGARGSMEVGEGMTTSPSVVQHFIDSIKNVGHAATSNNPDIGDKIANTVAASGHVLVQAGRMVGFGATTNMAIKSGAYRTACD